MSYGALAIHGINYWLSEHELLTHGSWTFDLYIIFTVHVSHDSRTVTSGSTNWLRNIFQKAYRCNYDCCFFLRIHVNVSEKHQRCWTLFISDRNISNDDNDDSYCHGCETPLYWSHNTDKKSPRSWNRRTDT